MNGMVLPMQMHMNQMMKVEAAPTLTMDVESGKFGAVLASMTTNAPMSNEVKTASGGIMDAIAELLDMTSMEEVMAFLQENGEVGFLEVMDGHFIVQDDELMALLETVFPGLEQMEMPGEESLYAIDMKDLLVQLETLAPALLAYVEGEGGTEQLAELSNDSLLKLFAVMQMVAIEAPKTDLIGKQEQQLQSLQEMLKSLGALLQENNAPKQTETRPVSLPFMEVITPVTLSESANGSTQQFKDQSAETTGQAAHTMTAAVKVDGATPVNEAQQNSRAEQLMKELQNVFKRANFGQTGGTNRISIKLYPEHLGQLRIELMQTNGILTARILASNVLGKEMLESQLHQLRQAFLQQNIQVERIDISQMLTETPQHEREQAFKEQLKQQQEEMTDQHSTEKEEEPMTFSEYMIELEG